MTTISVVPWPGRVRISNVPPRASTRLPIPSSPRPLGPFGCATTTAEDCVVRLTASAEKRLVILAYRGYRPFVIDQSSVARDEAEVARQLARMFEAAPVDDLRGQHHGRVKGDAAEA